MAFEKPRCAACIPSHLALVTSARAFIVEFCKAHGVDEGVIDAVALACHEALTNVIRHAHRHDFNKLVQVFCYSFNDRIEIHIVDEGEPFDMAKVPELDPTELRVGGRGVFLMRTIFDEVTCQPRGDGQGNVLRLVKYCNVKMPAPSQG